MTHPDILKMERLGELDYSPEPRRVGECSYCGGLLYDRMDHLVAAADGMFCDMDCCHSYYEIREL